MKHFSNFRFVLIVTLSVSLGGMSACASGGGEGPAPEAVEVGATTDRIIVNGVAFQKKYPLNALVEVLGPYDRKNAEEKVTLYIWDRLGMSAKTAAGSSLVSQLQLQFETRDGRIYPEQSFRGKFALGPRAAKGRLRCIGVFCRAILGRVVTYSVMDRPGGKKFQSIALSFRG